PPSRSWRPTPPPAPSSSATTSRPSSPRRSPADGPADLEPHRGIAPGQQIAPAQRTTEGPQWSIPRGVWTTRSGSQDLGGRRGQVVHHRAPGRGATVGAPRLLGEPAVAGPDQQRGHPGGDRGVDVALAVTDHVAAGEVQVEVG